MRAPLAASPSVFFCVCGMAMASRVPQPPRPRQRRPAGPTCPPVRPQLPSKPGAARGLDRRPRSACFCRAVVRESERAIEHEQEQEQAGQPTEGARRGRRLGRAGQGTSADHFGRRRAVRYAALCVRIRFRWARPGPDDRADIFLWGFALVLRGVDETSTGSSTSAATAAAAAAACG